MYVRSIQINVANSSHVSIIVETKIQYQVFQSAKYNWYVIQINGDNFQLIKLVYDKK